MKALAFFLLPVLSLLFIASIRSGNKKIKFHIQAHISGLKDDSIFFIKVNNARSAFAKTDTLVTVSRNGKFELWGQTDKVIQAVVRLGTKGAKYFSLFLENGTTYVNGHIDSVEKVRLSGTPENELYTVAHLRQTFFYDSMNVFNTRLKNIADKKSAEAISLSANADRMRDSVLQFWIDFTASHPDALTSGIYMYLLQDRISLEKLEPLYNNLTDKVKNGDYGPGVKEKIIARKRTAIGNAAPSFAVKDMDGKTLSLDAYKGKYILLDFWASWCVPCRAENPALKAAYQKYRDKGFTIISMSLDSDAAKWREAIIKDSLPWTHACEAYGTANSVALLYGVQPIPDNFLISPEGKIIGRGLRGDEVEKSLSQYLK